MIAAKHLVPGWYACRTRARAEKQVNRMLRQRGIEPYLPLVDQVRQWTDRRKRVAFPLFPGYVFAHFGPGLFHLVLRTPGVVTVVGAAGAPIPVRADELDSIRLLVESVNAGNPPPQPAEFVEVGQEVVVAEGPFSGMRGVLTEERGQTRVIVRLSALRKALSVELPREILRAAS